ncbi:hypothetical protein Hanom_Chr15g01356821 [Helianthus anomalus]
MSMEEVIVGRSQDRHKLQHTTTFSLLLRIMVNENFLIILWTFYFSLP